MDISSAMDIRNTESTKIQKCSKCSLRFQIPLNFGKMGITALVLCVLLGYACAQDNIEINVDKLLNSLDQANSNTKAQVPVALNWGIGDASAIVGRLFNHAIPADAFRGDILSITVTTAGADTLPSWLQFDKETHQLKGVPSPSDAGRHYLEVLTKGPQNSQAKDVFSIHVKKEEPSEYVMPVVSSDNTAHKRCRRDLPETSVHIVVDSDLDKLSVQDRLGLFEKMANFLNLEKDILKLTPMGDKPIMDKNAYAFGPGDTQDPKNSGVLLSWLIGCGSVGKSQMELMEKVQSAAADGSMGKSLQQAITGWHVTNVKQQPQNRRRRAIHATATPVPTQSPPTEIVDGIKDSADMMTRSVLIQSTPTFKDDMEKTKQVDVVTEEPMMTKVPIMTTPKAEDNIKPSVTTGDSSELPTKPDGVLCPDDQQNRGPVKVNDMPPVLYFHAGKFSTFAVPNNLFQDCVYGDTTKLRLVLSIGTDFRSPPANYWASIRQKNDMSWVVEGLPMNENEGRVKHRITATNNDGIGAATVDFDITVLTTDGEMAPKPTHEVAFVLDHDYNTFVLRDRIAVTRKISRVFGDDNTDNISVLGIRKGSVVFSFFNNSLPSDSCAVDDISKMNDKLVDSNGELSAKAKKKMHPYKLQGLSVAPMGPCESVDSFPTLQVGKMPSDTKEPSGEGDTSNIDVKEDATDEVPYEVDSTTASGDVNKAGQEEDDGEVWVTTVVPAVVIVAILLIALIIACILYRKKRKGKMSLEEKNTFVNKGTPVIFPDEYDEKPNDSSKPLIMDEEKPPIPPPEYTRASSESSRSSDHKVEEQEMNETNVHSPLYQPPPPVTSSGGNKQPRPHVQPPAQNPAPYVPP